MANRTLWGSTVLTFMLYFLLVASVASSVAADNYEIRKIADSVYAALAHPGSKAVSNALFVVTEHEVILAGAHFVREGVEELVREIGKVTPLPVSHVILTHHHHGFNYVDFDLPEKAEVVASAQIWRELTAEMREFRNSNLVFDETLTLNRGGTSLVLLNMGKGHSDGDVVVYLPKEGILFTSDLVFNDTVGYMGEASVLDWGENIERLATIPARIIVPGVGKVTDSGGIARFQKFYRAFMTEVLRNVEKGNSLAQTRKEFSLDAHKALPGFSTFLDVNLERAYKQLKSR
jgi:glyoxylase-like metal-dependent hydrolase (beta-lactamase superfamily II)